VLPANDAPSAATIAARSGVAAVLSPRAAARLGDAPPPWPADRPPPVGVRLVGPGDLAEAAAEAMHPLGWAVRVDPSVTQESVEALAARIVAAASETDGSEPIVDDAAPSKGRDPESGEHRPAPAVPRTVHIWVGEPAVTVPSGAGAGGRCGHVAALVARALRGRPVTFLAAASDGIDGTSGSGGAVIDGDTWPRAVAAGLDGLQAVCSTVVFGELDWSPGVHEQCAGRLHRDGQKDSVVAYYLVSDSGSDPVIADTLGLKQEQIAGVMDPEGEVVGRLQDGSARLVKMAEAYLAQRKTAR